MRRLLVCSVSNVSSCSYYDHRQRDRCTDVERLTFLGTNKEFFNVSRGSVGSRTLRSMMRELGHVISRFKVRGLMGETSLISRQPGSHDFKVGTFERPDNPTTWIDSSMLAFQTKSGVAISRTIGDESRCHNLALVMDLNTRKFVGWALSNNPEASLAARTLDMAFDQRVKPAGVMFQSDQGCQYANSLFRQRLWRCRMKQYMNRGGNC